MHRFMPSLPPCSRKITWAALLTVASLLIGQSAFAAVTKATLTPAVKNYSGNCPAEIVFKGSITVNAPGTVSYIFTRSDGATDTVVKKLKFIKPGAKAVSTSWTLGGPGLPQYKGWQAVKVLTPGVLESAHANFAVRCDPPLNSVKAAHGNTDWHIDTANEFLFGKDMAGNTTAANHAPDGWTKTHIHVGEVNAARFYNDKTRIPSGEDANLSNGIDKPMLFFYAGHGNPTTWNTLGNNGHQSGTLLGNIADGGQLRYYWQCSCEVFAHGPQVCSEGDCDYSAPENFDGSADSAAMRNVFERWGPALGNDLRMACGVSTLAYCHEGNVNAIWNKFNNEDATVAEAFILGLGSASVKPLCITRGGSSIAKTPLYDETFTNKANASGTGYLHILYAGGTQTDPPPFVWKPEKIPLKLWRVRLVPPGDPVEFKRLLTLTDKGEQLKETQLAGGAALVRRTQASGAVSLKATAPAPVKAAVKERALSEQRATALAFAQRIGWLEKDAGPVQVTALRTASLPEQGLRRKITNGTGKVAVSISRRISNGEQSLDVLGSGGRAVITLGPAGEVLAATKTWRQAELTREEVTIKPFERARDEALKRLGNTEMYTLAEWRFGYKEAAANVSQEQLDVVYEFDFVPKNRDRLIDYPPRRIEINAEQR